MTLAPLLNEPMAIQLHVICALVAVLLGPFTLYRRRRDRLHKQMGYVWVSATVLTAGSAIFIPSAGLALVGPFGPIHLFVVATLARLWQAISAIRAGQVARHEAAMRSLYWYAIGVPGLLTLIPGRRINQVLLPGWPEAGWALIVVGSAALFFAPRYLPRALAKIST